MQKLVHAYSQDRLSAEQRQGTGPAALELLSSMMQECQGRLSIELRLAPHTAANFTAFSSIHQQASSTVQQPVVQPTAEEPEVRPTADESKVAQPFTASQRRPRYAATTSTRV